MSGEIDRIVRMLEKTFEKQPWYGSSVTEVLSGAEPAILAKQMGHAHSIIELVLHMTSWRIFATKRMEGDNSFEVSDEQNFPKPSSWDDAIAGLKASQVGLVAAMKNFPEDRLGEIVPSKVHKYTYYTLLHGIIQHDIYHLGQIAILKKALEKVDS
jgi:uncharacterized damage-inducible protein DinB